MVYPNVQFHVSGHELVRLESSAAHLTKKRKIKSPLAQRRRVKKETAVAMRSVPRRCSAGSWNPRLLLKIKTKLCFSCRVREPRDQPDGTYLPQFVIPPSFQSRKKKVPLL